MIAASAISNRVRSSVSWSTSDIVASGLARLRLFRGLSRLTRRVEALKPLMLFGPVTLAIATVQPGYAGRASECPCSAAGAGSTRCDCTGDGAAVWGSRADASVLPSVCISRISDLKMRIDFPNERAASGSFFAPNNTITRIAMIAQGHGLRLPTVITSRRLSDATAAEQCARALDAPSGLSGDLVALKSRGRSTPYTLRERLRFEHPDVGPEAQDQARHPVFRGVGHDRHAGSVGQLAHISHRVVLEHPGRARLDLPGCRRQGGAAVEQRGARRRLQHWLGRGGRLGQLGGVHDPVEAEQPDSLRLAR